MTLTAVHGRKYTKQADAIADLNGGKDFMGHDFNKQGYTSLAELPEGYHKINFGPGDTKTVGIRVYTTALGKKTAIKSS